jgi:DNA topoisomerase-2
MAVKKDNDSSKKTLRASTPKKKTIEEQFTKKTQYQHILAEPDTYVGSTEMQKEEMNIMIGGAITSKRIKYVPALYKIVDEILVNARDETVRTKQCDEIRVDIEENGRITVWNNGVGIPNEMHKKEKMYVPTMIFGTLLTSGNYDQKGKTVGGKNGYGSKLANIFSKEEFTVENVDSKGVFFKQTWKKNMLIAGKPQIKKTKSKPYTQISFIPDYERFEMPDGLTTDMRALLQRRVWDLAACVQKGKKIKVSYNGKRIAVDNFKQYIKLHYISPKEEGEEDVEDDNNDNDNNDDEDAPKVKSTIPKLIYEESKNWKVGVLYDPDQGGRQVSFVNGLNTFRGGTHITDLLDRIVKKMTAMVLKKNKDLKLKPSQIKDNISIFVDCVIEDPSFGSQVKETLSTKVSKFSSRFDLSDDFVQKLGKSGLFDEAIAYAVMKQMDELKKTDGKKSKGVKDIEKLEDATKAGTRESHKCALILTEGDSAKASAIGGLSVVGRDYLGIFPLRGKLLNVRDVSMSKIASNKEIAFVKRIMGLRTGVKYTDVKTLRYAKIIIMADQDHDGTHIKGLIMNFIHHFWPELLYNVPEFEICSLKTPIVKVGEHNYFYTLPEFEQWMKDNNNGKGKGRIKYYKGLGTSTPAEAREWFVDFHKQLTHYTTEATENNDSDSSEDANSSESDSSDGESDSDDKKMDATSAALHLAFNKKLADDRKIWLGNYDPNKAIDHTQTLVSFDQFVNEDLIHYSNNSNHRNIPKMISGFKPSGGKILYTVKLKNLNKAEKEIRVSQLAGAISEVTEYHHGETSLVGAIINQGQDFPKCGNNINLIVPSGQFGGCMEGGKDAASGRYIHTYMEPITPLIFRVEDDPILNPIKDETEPDYVPIIPMILINGQSGIGTGYNSNIPSYNPEDVIANILRKIDGKKTLEMVPWYRGFTGTIKKNDAGGFTCKARYTIEDENTVHVYDLPPGVWNTPYKTVLNKIMDSNNPLISDYTPLFNDVKSECIITCVKGMLRKYSGDREGLESKLKLVKNINTNNMHAFNSKGRMHKYKNTEEIFDEFYHVRIEFYARRKKYLLNLLTAQIEFLNWKIKFIEYYLAGKIVLVKKGKGKGGKNIHLKKAEVIAQLVKYKFPMLNSPLDESKKVSYTYLTDIRIFDLTAEKMAELLADHIEKTKRFNKLKKTSEADLWRADLEELKVGYTKWNSDKLALFAKLEKSEAKSATTKGKKGKGGKKGVPEPKKKGILKGKCAKKGATKKH